MRVEIFFQFSKALFQSKKKKQNANSEIIYVFTQNFCISIITQSRDALLAEKLIVESSYHLYRVYIL